METTKIVYNACFGGFGLSMDAVKRYAELAGLNFKVKKSNFSGLDYYELTDANGEDVFERDLSRTDPFLVQVVEEMGKAVNTRYSALCIREVPKGTRYRIEEYDGSEAVITEDEMEWLVA